ncbi:unnamed protein product [Chrysoparadoxa australica]
MRQGPHSMHDKSCTSWGTAYSKSVTSTRLKAMARASQHTLPGRTCSSGLNRFSLGSREEAFAANLGPGLNFTPSMMEMQMTRPRTAGRIRGGKMSATKHKSCLYLGGGDPGAYDLPSCFIRKEDVQQALPGSRFGHGSFLSSGRTKPLLYKGTVQTQNPDLMGGQLAPGYYSVPSNISAFAHTGRSSMRNDAPHAQMTRPHTAPGLARRASSMPARSNQKQQSLGSEKKTTAAQKQAKRLLQLKPEQLCRDIAAVRGLPEYS